MLKGKPNIKPGNYARKVLLQFERVDKAFKDTETNIDDLNVLLDSVADSAKFMIPDNGDVGIRMSPDEIALRMDNIFRLPFPSTALEYSFDMERANGSLNHKMLLLCMEGFHSDGYTDFCSGNVNGFLIVPFLNHRDPDKWVMHPESNWISTENNSLISKQPFKSPLDYGYKPDLDGRQYFSEVLAHATETVLNFIVASQMKNVHFISLPADHGLNRKSIKRGSLPFHDYIVLDMNINALEKRYMSQGGSEREDPRAHAVAGHIKRRKTGIYWWNSFLRGNPEQGIIRKAYNVIKKNTNTGKVK